MLLSKRNVGVVLLMLLCMLAANCHTLPFTFGRSFSDETLRSAAIAIERAVNEGQRLPDVIEATPHLFRLDHKDITETIASRRTRLPLLNEFKDAAYIGENANGMAQVLLNNPTLKGDRNLRLRVGLVVMHEKDDRWKIYEGMAHLNRMGSLQRKKINLMFAEIHRERAKPNHMIQTPEGWVQKGEK